MKAEEKVHRELSLCVALTPASLNIGQTSHVLAKKCVFFSLSFVRVWGEVNRVVPCPGLSSSLSPKASFLMRLEGDTGLGFFRCFALNLFASHTQ